MKLYKDSNNEIFAYEDDGSQDDLIGDKIRVTQEEADAIIESKYDYISACKEKAKFLLADCDWSVLPDVNLANKQEFINYRNALRELVFNPIAKAVFPDAPIPVWQ